MAARDSTAIADSIDSTDCPDNTPSSTMIARDSTDRTAAEDTRTAETSDFEGFTLTPLSLPLSIPLSRDTMIAYSKNDSCYHLLPLGGFFGGGWDGF